MAAPPEVRLKRFLHYGSEDGIYKPGQRNLKLKDLPSVNAFLSNGKEAEPVVHIIKAFSDGYSAHKCAMIFALAACTRQKESTSLREAAYAAVKTVCTTSNDLFLFVKYTTELSGKVHTGHGWRRAVREWYLQREDLELAEVVTKHRGHYNWSHGDIIKLAHIKPNTPGKEAIFTYILRGLQYTTERFGNNEVAQSVVSYLQAVEEFKHSQDFVAASRIIESHSLKLEHVPTHGSFLKTKEVWCAVIPSLTLTALLENLQRMSVLGLLRGRSPLVLKYCDALNNPTALVEAKTHPARVYIELCTYELIAKDKVQMAVKLGHEWAQKREHGQIMGPKTNAVIIDALKRLFNSSFKVLIPTGLRYLVAVDGRDKLWSNNSCYKCRYVKPGCAALLIALSLIKTEREVIFGTFTGAQAQFTPIPVTEEATMDELREKLKGNAATIPPIVKTAFLWSEANKKPVDVFIVLSDSTMRVEGCLPGLMHYRRTMQLQNAKLITCSLTGPIKQRKEVRGNGMLCIFGFDEHVPRVIEAFSRGAF